MSDGANRYIGQRLSLNLRLCTIRYIGEVTGKAGIWLGAEWDDPTRGKHDGSHESVKYFSCRSSSPTAASFLRPLQNWDTPRTLLQAIQEKYFRTEDARSDDTVFISRSKQIEEIGFEKFAQRQAELRGIHVLVLDRMQIAANVANDHEVLKTICSSITDLDLSDNLFDKQSTLLNMCASFSTLKRLTLDGNRLDVDFKPEQHTLPDVSSISLGRTLLSEEELSRFMTATPNVREMHFLNNGISSLVVKTFPVSLRVIDLSYNSFSNLDALSSIISLPALQKLVLKNNELGTTQTLASSVHSDSLQDLDISDNQIADWSFCTQLQQAFPELLHLRVAGNPLYTLLCSADGKRLSTEDGYMLTIARLPDLRSLNYSMINGKDRLNAEKYYLSEIATELSRSTTSQASAILAKHPRWQALCAEYGEPRIDRAESKVINPNSLAARLITIHYRQGARTWTDEVPKAFSIYAVYGMVARSLQVLPIDILLTWETNERDPVERQNEYQGPQWWDSSDEEDAVDQTQWKMRTVVLTPGTRSIGSYIDSQEAEVRVDIQEKSI